MKPDKEYDSPLDDPPISRMLLQRIEQMLPDIQAVEVKYVKVEGATPRKIVRLDMEGNEHPEEIVGEIAQIVLGHAEKTSTAAHHYEAWVKREGKSTIHLRVKIDQFGDMRDETDPSEMQVLLAAAMQFVENAKSQNAELHGMIKDLVVELRMMAAPQKDAMAEMGKIVASSYQQMYYAFSLISQEKAAEREAELSAKKWEDGFDMVKEFFPEAVKQYLGKSKKNDEEEDDDEPDEPETEYGADEDKTPGSGSGKTTKDKKRKGKGKKPKASLWEACQGFGASLDGLQMAKLRKLLSEKQMTWLEEAMAADNDIDAAVAVNHLRKALTSQSMKNKMMNVLPFGTLGLLSAILKGASKVDVSKAAKEKQRKAGKTTKPKDGEESVSEGDG